MRLTIQDQTGGSEERAAAVRRAIEAYLERGREADFQSTQLAISIDEFALHDSLMLATLSVQGKINGQPIDKSFSHTRHDRGVPFVHAGGILGAIVCAVILGAVDLFLWLAKQRSSEVEQNHSLHECVGGIITLLDQHTWQSQSTLARRWQYLQIFKWLVSLGMFTSLCVLGALHLELKTKGQYAGLIIGAAFCSACLYLFIHLLCLLSMPYAFYRTEPRGIKALARTGISSVSGMKAFVLTFLFTPFFLVLVIVIWNSLRHRQG
jgi:cytochrome bd-type quinol oxidase subunit 2